MSPIFDRLEIVTVTCPASIPVAAPVEVAFTFAPGIVRHIWLVIPSGHAGLTGISLGFGHTPICPYQGGQFVSGDQEVMDFDWRDRNPGVKWSAFVCNLDTQAHTWQVRVGLDELVNQYGAITTQPVDAGAIEQAAGQIISVT